MTRTIMIPDETYERLEQMAASQHETLNDLLIRWATEFETLGKLVYSSMADERSVWTLGFLHGAGLDDELVAHVLAAPEEKRGHELRLALTVLDNERAGRDPLKEPRHLTFEQFFSELGHTDQEIDEAKRRAAAHADL